MSEGGEIAVDHSEEVGFSKELKKLEGLELIQGQAVRLSELVQKEIEAGEVNSAEDEAEFQGYMRGWVAEYQRLFQAGPEHQAETLEVLGMIQALLGDLPIEEGLLPENIYDALRKEEIKN